MGNITYNLNGTMFTFAEETGALVLLSHPGCGEIIQDGGGLVDLAWPVKFDYEILRCDPCGKYFPCRPDISFNGRSIRLRYARLGQNTRTPDLPALQGGVAAEITLTACEDGRSVALSCRIDNHSQTAVRQILFPNLTGLQPVAGDATRFTGLQGYDHPFRELSDEGDARDAFYAVKPSVCGKFYEGGGYFGGCLKVGRWFDYGGLSGGLSVFAQHWGYGPDKPGDMGRQDVTWVKLDNLSHTLRVAGVHDVTVEPGGTYESETYVLTPHAGGWVQGVAPYKAWVDAHKHRCVPVPQSVREMLGYRTIWATEQYPDDPDAAIWPYDAYPVVAADMAEHGLYKLNVWGMFEWILPLTRERFFPQQGGFDRLKEVVAEVRALGVEVIPFVSWLSIWEKMRARYGFEQDDGSENGWSENLKGIPVFRTPYMRRYCCAFLHKHDNPLWIDDIKAALRFLRDELGTPSISWDQYILDGGWTLYEIIDEYRRETHALYPEADFSAESTFFFEADIDQLDYTWDWIYRNGDIGQDPAPYLHVVETTRPQMIVDANPLYLKYAFMDNVCINVYPSKPENVNGSALIRDFPALSATIKHCAALRKAYLPYFTEGKILGDCVLSQECGAARVTGYLLDDRMLLFAVLREDASDGVEISYDLTPFVHVNSFHTSIRDEENREIELLVLPAKGALRLQGRTGTLLSIEFVPAGD